MSAHITSETIGPPKRIWPVGGLDAAAGVMVLGGTVWNVRTVHSVRELGLLSRQMGRVHAESAQRSPFSTLAFIESYVRHNEYFSDANGVDLVVACAFAGDKLVGYAPLKRVRTGPLAQSRLEFLCTHDSELPHIVARAADEARVGKALVQYLLEHEPAFTMLELKEQSEDSTLLDTINSSATRSSFYARRFPSADVAVINVRWRSLADYYEAFNKKFRSNVARQVRRLMALRDVELVSVRHPHDLNAAFDVYLDLERRSWKAQADGVIGRHPERVAFFRELIARAQPFELSFDFLCAGDEPVAGIINGRHGSKLFALQNVYDEAFHDSGPGVLMLLWSMKRAIEELLDAYHLLHGSAYYKTRWLADITRTQSMQYFRLGSAAHVKARLGEAKRWLQHRKPPVLGALKFNREKRAILEAPRPHLSTEARARSRLLVERCKSSAGAVIVDRYAIANAMPFRI